MTNSETFQFSQFPKTLHNIKGTAVIADYRRMLLCIIETIVERYERDPDYHFIDTKLSMITGDDFDAGDPIRGKGVIYSWIQGRGLEALAGYSTWLKQHKDIEIGLRTQLLTRIETMLSEVLDQMESLRKKNGGRLFFMTSPSGTFLHINEEGQTIPFESPAEPPYNFSDLYYAKGMVAAAKVLGREKTLTEACHYFQQITDSILNNRFISDQQPLDPKNIAAKPMNGLRPLGPKMIAVGGAARFLQSTNDPIFRKIGFQLIDSILDHYTNTNQENELSRKYDMWEINDPSGAPYLNENNVLLNDPGHACEFVGLALKLICDPAADNDLTEQQKKKADGYKQLLPCILEQNFANGFSKQGFGICKAFDLSSRTLINGDMPWWSLPETMRSAMLAWHIVPSEKQPAFVQIIAKCSNAFIHHYIKPELNLMAVQTLNKKGQTVDVIPATPDADPGYHTSLSIIDFLESYER